MRILCFRIVYNRDASRAVNLDYLLINQRLHWQPQNRYLLDTSSRLVEGFLRLNGERKIIQVSGGRGRGAPQINFHLIGRV